MRPSTTVWWYVSYLICTPPAPNYYIRCPSYPKFVTSMLQPLPHLPIPLSHIPHLPGCKRKLLLASLQAGPASWFLTIFLMRFSSKVSSPPWVCFPDLVTVLSSPTRMYSPPGCKGCCSKNLLDHNLPG